MSGPAVGPGSGSDADGQAPSSGAPEGGPTKTGSAPYLEALADALVTEHRLLEQLARALVAQRQGLSSDDLDTLGDSVFTARRVLRTLQAAREGRRTLLRLAQVPDGTPLKDLASGLGPRMTPRLTATLDGLVLAAERLAKELTANRRMSARPRRSDGAS